MAHISEKEAGCHQRDSSPNIQTPRSGKSKLEPVTMSKLMEAFTTCDDTHREVVTYGCTVCYVLICDDCYLKQRSIGYRCSSKDDVHILELLEYFNLMVGSQITKRLKRIQQLVNLVQKLRRAVGVYHAPNIETLVGKLEAGVTELTRLSEEMILAESEEDCDDEPQEEWSDEYQMEPQETPSTFQFRGTCDERVKTCSVYYDHHSCLTIQKEQVQIRGSHLYTFPVEQVPISLCMDGEYGYAISKDSYIRKFNLGSGETIHKWPVPNNSPYHHQMAVINGKIYYCNVNNNEIIIFPTSKESTLEESRMSLEILEKPCYITANTKHQEGTVIVSGPSGVAKFPIIHGISEPKWFSRAEHARGICVDSRGLIYVAKCQPSMICMLCPRTGSSLMEILDVQLPDEMWEIAISERQRLDNCYIAFVAGNSGLFFYLSHYQQQKKVLIQSSMSIQQ